MKERYNLVHNEWELIIYPYKPAIKTAWRWVIAIIPAAIIVAPLQELLGKVIWSSLYVIMTYGLLYSLYEILLKAKVHYRFSVRDNAVYKSTLFYQHRKILQLNEVAIFTSSETGSWWYAMGARKTQFIKNYRISEHFGGGNKHEEYEQEVLDPINALITKS